MTVLEKISDDTLVFLQVHKRIWPTAQRDALFWSHQTHKSDPQDEEGHDIWAVVNHSTNLPQYPVSFFPSKFYLKYHFNVIFYLTLI